MKKLNVCLLLIIVSLLMTGVVTAQETIMVYTSVPTANMTSIQQAFEAANPDIKLEVFRSGTGTIQTKIATEAEIGNVQADIVWVADFSYYESLKKQGLLAPVFPTEAANLPNIFKEEDGYYYAGRLINMVIAYNTNLVSAEDAPTSWGDLLDDKWYDNIVMPNPNHSGAAVAVVGGLTQAYGWKYFEDLRNNEGAVVRGPSDAARAIAGGEFKVGMTLDNTVRGLKAATSPIELVYPEDGIIAVPSPIAVIATSEKKDASLKFMEYILSTEGQQMLVQEASYTPVRLDVAPPVGAPEADTLIMKAMDIDWSAIEENLEEQNERFSDIMLF